jgi:nucleotide-binding universal stress UspA family protein
MEQEKKEKKGKRRIVRKIRNIIVGIDFSEGSLNAMQNALVIAEKFNAKVTLLFVISMDAKTFLGTDNLNKTSLYPILETKLKDLVAECKRILPKNTIKHKIRMGKASKEINLEAEEQGDALIVLGTHGCSGFKEFFIGSSAFRTVSGSSCPVLTVRNGINIMKHLTDILIVIDDTMETLQKLQIAADIAKNFYAKVHVVGLYPAKYPNIRFIVEGYMNQAVNYLVRQNIRIKSTFVENEGKVETVLKYASKNNINLIVIMKEVELAGKEVFILAPFSEKIVHRSPVPILTIEVDPIIYP